MYHSESGVLNYGPMAEPGEEDIDLINAGGQFLAMSPGMSFFSSADAFAMIRGGHVDVAVLGALQVSERGDLANWMLPERGVGNVGGAMDLAAGARRVIAAMEHTDRNGNSKLVRECAYPPTARECVSLVVTDIAVVEIGPAGAVLIEIAPGWTADDVSRPDRRPAWPCRPASRRSRSSGTRSRHHLHGKGAIAGYTGPNRLTIGQYRYICGKLSRKWGGWAERKCCLKVVRCLQFNND